MFAACGSSLMGHHTACEKFGLAGFIPVILFTMRPYLSFDTLYRVNNNCYSSLGQRFKALHKTTVNCWHLIINFALILLTNLQWCTAGESSLSSLQKRGQGLVLHDMGWEGELFTPSLRDCTQARASWVVLTSGEWFLSFSCMGFVGCGLH